MSTESKNKWRLLHELCLKAKEAKDFETLGAVVEELAELKTSEGNAAKFGNGQCFAAISNAYIVAWKKLSQWQENPPPIAPQETQIGPGNPFPVPPPPPPPTVAQGEWTGSLVFERIAPKGLTNPVGYRAATPEEQAELDRMARAINRNTPLFEPTPQAQGSLEALSAKAIAGAAEPVRTPEPWTGESLYLAADMQLMEAPGDWATLTSSQQKFWMFAAAAANERMGVVYK